MKNLAGKSDCDVYILLELGQAGVEIVEHEERLDREVRASITGQLTKNGEVKFTFTRAWYYWIVTGEVPLEVAREMYYGNKVGQKDVRVAGHCGCPPPENWAFPKREVLAEVLSQMGIDSITYGDLARLCNDDQINAPRFIDCYHIDSQEGLNLFVATLKNHDLVV